MGWRFRLIGRHADRGVWYGTAALCPPQMPSALVQAIWGRRVLRGGVPGHPRGGSLEAAAAALRTFCQRYRVEAILVGSAGRYPGTVRWVAQLAFPGKEHVYPGLEVIRLST